MSIPNNIALGKPALQSSTSFWSRGATVAADARHGNDGQVGDVDTFHTEFEKSPWWQVDLENIYNIKKIYITNRKKSYDRLRRFTILASMDGEEWLAVYSKIDDGVFGEDGTPYIITFTQKICARFVRIRLDTKDYLHFVECEIQGTLLSKTEAAKLPAPLNSDAVVVFSTLFNESDSFLQYYITNFIQFTPPNCVLAINFPIGREIPAGIDRHGGRVHIFNGGFKREKWGNTLLLGHLETYDYALKTIGTFDYFCSMASNALFVRPFETLATIREIRLGRRTPLGVEMPNGGDLDINHLPNWWRWQDLMRHEELFSHLKDRWAVRQVSQNQIEGLIAASGDWGAIHSRRDEIATFGDYLLEGYIMPMEEILPCTMMTRFGSGQFASICHVFWSRFASVEEGYVKLTDIADMSATYPSHICALKWFDRDPRVTETALVTRPWSRDIVADLTDALHGGSAATALAQRVLFEALAKILFARETATPLAQGWWPEITGEARQCHYHATDIKAARQIEPLPAGSSGLPTPGYMYFENTGHALDLEITVSADGPTRITIDCKAPGVADHRAGVPQLEAYLYLNTQRRSGNCLYRLRMPAAKAERDKSVGLKVALAHGSQYQHAPVLYKSTGEDCQEYYLGIKKSPEAYEAMVGLPIFANMRSEIEIEIISIKN